MRVLYASVQPILQQENFYKGLLNRTILDDIAGKGAPTSLPASEKRQRSGLKKKRHDGLYSALNVFGKK